VHRTEHENQQNFGLNNKAPSHRHETNYCYVTATVICHQLQLYINDFNTQIRTTS